jgi:predicted nucleotide-binding protein (sugar kinase/HSP70/actin superfamily)
MSTYDRYPFWHRYLTQIGCEVVLSRQTDSRISADGIEYALAQPCYPVQVAHGHVKALIDLGVDYILVPNILNAESDENEKTSAHFCPWNQTLPFVIKAVPQFEEYESRFLMPAMHFQLGRDYIKDALAEMGARLGVKRRISDAAVDSAYAAQRDFQERLLEAVHRATALLEETGEPGLILVGRSYNIYDRGINCDIPKKLRNFYGANVIPLDFLVTGKEPIADIHPNMFWTSGRKILEAARFVGERPNLHLIYISNFKCGPDSYIKYFARQAAGAPLLVLTFDGHGNDAGFMTRCEAYLDSKGILRCYSSPESQHPSQAAAAGTH